MEMKSFAAGFAAGKAQGGGGGEAVLINKSISANGAYLASTDKADGFKKVTVSVANSYTAGDEGKVVSGGALVSQTAHAKVTSNGTIDTTLNNSVEVEVSGGGTLVTKTITQNGTYYASGDSADGYSQVVVNVSGGGGTSFSRATSVVDGSLIDITVTASEVVA